MKIRDNNLIEKETREGDLQKFREYSRKEMAEVIKNYFESYKDALKDERFSTTAKAVENYFEDCGIFWQTENGATGSITSFGLEGKRPAVSQIKKFYENGFGIYEGYFGDGISPEYNEKYGDWEINL
jgi:hypothetical protein